MGDGGWRRIDAEAARHILTRVGLSALGTAHHGRLLSGLTSQPSGGRLSAPYVRAALHRRRPFRLQSCLSRRRQRGQKPLAAPRYSIAVTLRRIRI